MHTDWKSRAHGIAPQCEGLVEIDHHSLPACRIVKGMPGKKIKEESGRALLALIKKEMALPRITKSARLALRAGFVAVKSERVASPELSQPI